MSKTKMVNTDTLRGLTQVARDRHYNRVLDPEDVEQLDPEGIHLLDPLLFHEHAAGKQTDLVQWRCRAYLKMKDDDSSIPYVTMLDIACDKWDGLADVTNIEERDGNGRVA